MSSSEGSQTVRLLVEARDALTEIFIISPQLERVARGSGALSRELQPGIYKVIFKAGSLGGPAYGETLVALTPEQEEIRVGWRQASLQVASPVPMHHTSTTHEYHRYPAMALSRSPAHPVGLGSHLVIVVRDLDGAETDNPLDGLTLHSMDSEATLVALGNVAEVFRDISSGYISGSSEAAGGCHLELAPGSYRLRAKHPQAGDVEQIVVTSAGWQTQIFIARQQDETQRWPDLRNTSVLMTRPEQGIDFENPELDIIEKARLALAEGQASVGAAAAQRMLHAKSENPMLGIYAAHLLLLSSEPDLEIFDVVLPRLEFWVPDHPDVRALRLWRQLREGSLLGALSFPSPPLLKRSWHIVREAAVENDELVPLPSQSALVVGRELCDTMWLVWSTDADLQADRVAAASALEERWEPLLAATTLKADLLPPLEQEIVNALRTLTNRRDSPVIDTLSRMLRVPKASVALAFGRLMRKTEAARAAEIQISSKPTTAAASSASHAFASTTIAFIVTTPPPPIPANQITFTIATPTAPIFLGTLQINALPPAAGGVIGSIDPGTAAAPAMHTFRMGAKFQQIREFLLNNQGRSIALQITYDDVTFLAIDASPIDLLAIQANVP